MSEHAQIRELLPLYALGALEGSDECDVVCSHLATGCPECTAELAEHARVATRLGDALAPVEPRPDVRAALAKTLAASPRVKEAKVIPIKAVRSKPAWPWIGIPTAAAAAWMVAAVNQNQQLSWAPHRPRGDAKEIATLTADLARVRRALADDEEITTALAKGVAQVIELAPSKGETGSGVVIWDKKAKTWTLLASGMKPLTQDQVYELWFVRADLKDVRSAVRFEAGPDGLVRQTVSVPAGMQIDLAAITVEPKANDAPGPTMPPIIAGKTQA